MAELDLEALRRRLAAIEHQRWADWQRWMHEQCTVNTDGEYCIPKELVERWERQIATSFDQLSEAEQRSDFEQVDRYWPLIGPALERAEEVADQGCEYCEAMVTDRGEDDEPHGQWWVCGQCWNASARETSTIIAHLSDLLDHALERMSELERWLERMSELERWLSNSRQEQVKQMAHILELERSRTEWSALSGRWQRHAEQAVAELAHCSDDLGRAREALNDTMHRAEQVEAAAREAVFYMPEGTAVRDHLRAALDAAPAEEGR